MTVALVGVAAPAGAASLPAGAGTRVAASGIEPATSPVAWNGTDLVAAAIAANGNLVASEQAPGATSWAHQTVEKLAANGGVTLGTPSVTATATSVQIVSEEADGNIWFYQQQDGQTSWSAPQLVGTVSVGSPEGTQAPRIAWTGVPGHTGTNSVITIADAAGDVLFFYQNGDGWAQETVEDATATNAYYEPALTATDKGVVIVAPGTNGVLFSFFQAYGAPTWGFGATVGVGAGQAYGPASVTWDGTNVDVAAPFYDGSGATLVLLWKSDTAEFWSDQALPGVSGAQPLFYDPSIAYTGFNLILTAVQQLSGTRNNWTSGGRAAHSPASTGRRRARPPSRRHSAPRRWSPPTSRRPTARWSSPPPTPPTSSAPQGWTTGPSPPAAKAGPNTPSPHPDRPAAPGRGANSHGSRHALLIFAAGRRAVRFTPVAAQEARTLAFCCSNSSGVMTPRSRRSASLVS